MSRNSNIGITMLGSSGSGKTCYMMGMYAVMSLGVNGFNFTTQDPDDDLVLADQWENFAQKGIWPDPTTASKNWNFNCTHGFKSIMGFTWHDYRGAAFREQGSQNDVKILFDQMYRSSCLIFCVSGEVLSQIVENPNIPQRDMVRFNNLMSQFMKQNNDNPIPIVIAITKADLCKGERLKRGIKILKEQFLSTLFQDGAEWWVMFCPVSLGENMNNTWNVKPINLHLPVTFAIYATLYRDFSSAQKDANQKGLTTRDKISTINTLEGSFLSKIFQRGKIREEKAAFEMLQREYNIQAKECDTLQRHLELVKAELLGEQIETYYNGNKIIL